MFGTITFKIACICPQPKSLAASSMEWSNPSNVPLMVLNANGVQNVICAMMIVGSPN